MTSSPSGRPANASLRRRRHRKKIVPTANANAASSHGRIESRCCGTTGTGWPSVVGSGLLVTVDGEGGGICSVGVGEGSTGPSAGGWVFTGGVTTRGAGCCKADRVCSLCAGCETCGGEAACCAAVAGAGAGVRAAGVVVGWAGVPGKLKFCRSLGPMVVVLAGAGALLVASGTAWPSAPVDNASPTASNGNLPRKTALIRSALCLARRSSRRRCPGNARRRGLIQAEPR